MEGSLEGLRNNKENLSQDIRSSAQNVNPQPLEYKAGMITTQPRRSLRV